MNVNGSVRRNCLWRICELPATNRYPIDLCQEHILYVWSLVDDDIRRAGTEPDLTDPEDRMLAKVAAENKQAGRPTGSIYYLQVGDYLKIGYTKNLRRRLRQYPPNAILLAHHPGTEDDERRLHSRFAAYCDAGREWYLDTQEIRDHIAGIADRPPTPVAKSRTTTPARPKASTRRAWTYAL